jgi:voltage-gated potassium channel Kch
MLSQHQRSMKPRIIVCGLGRTGSRIYTLLKNQGADVVGISDRLLPVHDSQIIIGELRARSTLIQAGIQQAQTLILASNDDALNVAILTEARVLNPQIRIINRLYNQTLGDRLDHIIPDHVTMSVASLASPIFAFAALGNKAIGQLHLYDQTWPIHEEIIEENHPWLGQKLSELWSNPSRMLIYYLPAMGEMDLVSAVITGETLQKGDHLIVGTQPTFRHRQRPFFKKIVKAILNLKRYKDYIQPVVLVILTLLMTILLATLTYVCVNLEISIVDALYFSVGMITGAGGKEEVAESAPDLIKVFTAIMMIVGAGIIGICYALINDFILGSRIKQFWDATRLPTHNHYIICGLGGIGMQIARQLHTQGYEVVVIESNHNNRFIHYARSLGIPVIIEDGRLVSTLKAANIDKAQSLLVVTSNDMVNVEIALTAKAITPKLDIVMRNHDPQFAQSSKEVFDFETVFSPTELATPSFVAAALGGRILGNGMTNDLLWVALATLITPKHPFCGHKVKQAAIAADFVPLYLETESRTIHDWQLLETCLRSGDVLYLTIPASKVEQIWRKTLHQELMIN